ncbi:GNAT family N-acetyltransferase [Pleurocapsa sp. PCC 7319]|uniref:GNAT family N-acetyltransferase n=1 Tax=Pleurocapsa sp. PCC 7319 TaxID=118161 RepID=UPI00035E87B8|nr:GNAT family N-acetyltransferase [Pleurocapsa sp. PCC 7319]
MHSLTRLTTFGEALLYSPLTYPTYRPRLQNISSDENTVAIGISIAGKPIGLGIAETQADKSAQVLSLFVAQAYRHQGFGTALLTRLEQELYLEGCKSVEFVYTTGQTTTSTVEHLLDKCGWSSPQPRRVICKASTHEMSNAPWMRRRWQLPASYSIFPWVKITPRERSLIQEQEVKSWIHPDLIPFKYEEGLEPINSVGLRYKGQVVGWLINHRTAPDTIRYSCSYIRPDLQKLGRITFLYIKAVQLQAAANIPFGIWTIPLEHTSMVNFAKKHMKPYSIYLQETKGASKLLFSDQELGLHRCVESMANR